MDGGDCNIPFAFFKKKRGDNEEGAFVEAVLGTSYKISYITNRGKRTAKVAVSLYNNYLFILQVRYRPRDI